MNEMSSDLIFERISLSDYSSFEQLYNQYGSALLKIAFKKLKDKDLAMDVVQDLFVDLWQRRSTLSINRSAQSFLVSALYFKIYQHFRKDGLSKKHIEHFFALQSADSIEDYQTNELEESYQELMGHIEGSIEHMPERMREIFRLKYYRSYSNQEIADRLGISNQTVRNQLSKSLDYLRSELGEKITYHTAYGMTVFALFVLHDFI